MLIPIIVTSNCFENASEVLSRAFTNNQDWLRSIDKFIVVSRIIGIHFYTNVSLFNDFFIPSAWFLRNVAQTPRFPARLPKRAFSNKSG